MPAAQRDPIPPTFVYPIVQLNAQKSELQLEVSVATEEEVWMIREWAAQLEWNPGRHDPEAWLAHVRSIPY